jgi:hypothetical protein
LRSFFLISLNGINFQIATTEENQGSQKVAGVKLKSASTLELSYRGIFGTGCFLDSILCEEK